MRSPTFACMCVSSSDVRPHTPRRAGPPDKAERRPRLEEAAHAAPPMSLWRRTWAAARSVTPGWTTTGGLMARTAWSSGHSWPARSSGVLPGGRRCPAPQQGDDLVVGRLAEVVVELADGHEPPRQFEAHHLVRLAPQLVHRVGRGHRCGEHDPGGTLTPGHPACDPGGR